jgi:hypothetical protein
MAWSAVAASISLMYELDADSQSVIDSVLADQTRSTSQEVTVFSHSALTAPKLLGLDSKRSKKNKFTP